MRSYPQWIDGVEDVGKGWTYVVHASELIRDLQGALTLKRQLELGELEPEAAPSAKVAGRCAWGNVDDCRRAVGAAARARSEYARFSLKDRLEVAAGVREEVERRVDEITAVLVSEGHPKRVAEWEISGMWTLLSPETLGWMAKQLEQEMSWNGTRLKIVRKPEGVVCVSPPPHAAAADAFVGALALLSGNTLVVRAPRSAPLGVMYLYHEILGPVFERFGVPRGTFNVISGDGRATLQCCLEDPRVDALLFFGSSKTGMQIGREWTEKGKKAVLELSGNDGFVVWKDADLERSAATLLEAFTASGQLGIAPKFGVVHPSVADPFLERFVARACELKPGYPEDPDTLLTPALKMHEFFDTLTEAKQHGVEVLCGGRQIEIDGTPSPKGFFIEPTVVRVSGFELAERLTCVREETFFPLLPVVVPAPDRDDVLLDRTIRFLNANRYGLRNSLWSGDRAAIERFIAEVRNGGLLKVNDSHMCCLPYLAAHGGTGRSGGPYGELSYPSLRLSRLQGIAIGS